MVDDVVIDSGEVVAANTGQLTKPSKLIDATTSLIFIVLVSP